MHNHGSTFSCLSSPVIQYSLSHFRKTTSFLVFLLHSFIVLSQSKWTGNRLAKLNKIARPSILYTDLQNHFEDFQHIGSLLCAFFKLFTPHTSSNTSQNNASSIHSSSFLSQIRSTFHTESVLLYKYMIHIYIHVTTSTYSLRVFL